MFYGTYLRQIFYIVIFLNSHCLYVNIKLTYFVVGSTLDI